MPIWSSTPLEPTPTSVTLLTPFNWISVAVVSQLPLALVVLPWLMVPDTRMMIGVLTDARAHSAALICAPVLAVTVVPPLPPVVERPKPIGVLPPGVTEPPPLLLEDEPPLTVMVCARVETAPQLLVYVAVAVQDAVGLTVCVREVPEVPHPDQAQLPPEEGRGAKF